MLRSDGRTIPSRRRWAGRSRTLLVAATLAIGPTVLGWTPSGVPATARADCCGMLGPIRQLMALGDTLVFTAYDARHGWELWRSDGTAKGTRLVKDIRPGRKGSGPEDVACDGCSDSVASPPIIVGVAGGSLVLWADDGRHGLEPWRSDGTAKGTRLLRDIRPGRKGSARRDGARAPRRSATCSTSARTTVRTPRPCGAPTGRPQGTTLVTDFAGLSDLRSAPWTLTAGRRRHLLPSASSDVPDRPELWRSDGTAEGTLLVTTSDPGSGLQDLVAAGGALYFADQVIDVPDSARLWRSDGTAEGTIPIKQPISLAVPFVTALGETVYFGHTAFDNTTADGGWLTRLELWRTDGSAGGDDPRHGRRA